jgi:hypothetical protein
MYIFFLLSQFSVQVSLYTRIILQSAADSSVNKAKSPKAARQGCRLTNEERNCIQMFRTSDYEKHKARNPDRVDGTCQWFLQHPKFRNWRDSKISGLLWVSADPGCGKSVLSKSLVDNELLSTKSRTTCYFFFKDDDIDQKSVTKALCALIHQLLSHNDVLVKYAIPDFRHEGTNLLQCFGKLWSILTKAGTDPDASEVICVLDALDECEESRRFELIDTLNRFYRNATSHGEENIILKFLVTSRPYFDIERRFAELTSSVPTIRLAGEDETELIKGEIDIVIKAKVQKIGMELMLDNSERLSLENDLLSITHRTYLWLKLIFEVIEQRLAVTKKRLRGIVGTIPDTLDKAYEAILERSVDKEQARKLLHIIVSAVRPLTLREMNIALAIDEGSRSEEDLDLEREDRFRITVRNLCGLFVSVIDSRIYLIHQTAKEFLVKNDIIHASSMGIWKHSLEPSESNLVLAKICISYLLFPVFEFDPIIIVAEDKIASQVNQYVNGHGLLDYSAKHWATHFRRAKIMDGAIVELASEVCNCRSRRILTWFQVYWMPGFRCPRYFSDLMIGSYFGLDVVVKVLLEKGADIKAKGFIGTTALHWAAKNGHDTVVRLLLEKGADIEAKDSLRRTALHWAAKKGHDTVVRLLLEKGADIEAKDSLRRTALHWVANNGHDTVVWLLLEKGADIEAKDEDGWTALGLAVVRGHKTVVRLLVEKWCY